MKKESVIVVLMLTVMLSTFTVFVPVRGDPPNPFEQLPSPVNHTMTVRIVLVGIDDVDRQQFLWNLEPIIKPAILSNHSPTGLQDLSYGDSFAMNYDIVSANSTVKRELTSYLQSIATTRKVPDSLQRSGSWSSDNDTNNYAIIPADQTEDWLNSHIADFGGIPDNGYSLIVTDVSSVSSLYHYYEKTYLDLDKASINATNYKYVWPLTDWMFSWGGHHRFYYLDLSGGDPTFDYSAVGHIPIQNFTTRYYSKKAVTFQRSIQTVTEYVADYVAEAVRNLLLPSYVYTPAYASSYEIAINVFDDTGRISGTNIGDYLSPSLVKNAFTKIIPGAMWRVSLSTHELSDNPDLRTVVSDSILFSRNDTGSYDKRPVHIDYYDYRPIYAYLQVHLAQYVPDINGTVVLPTFEFIFKNSSRFADTSEESIGANLAGALDGQRRTFGGVALGDMVLIGRSERALFAFGTCLSEVTIHENGHQIGLMHPHQYGKTEDYVSSPMSYVTYPYEFSQFDADAIQRASSDYALSVNQQKEAEYFTQLQIGGSVMVGVAIGLITYHFILRKRLVHYQPRSGVRNCPRCGFPNRLNARYCVKDRTPLQ